MRRSIVVMQQPSVRILWLDTMNPFYESFNDLTIVLFINCLSLRHEFLMNNALTVEKNKLTWFWFLICSFLHHFGAVSCSCATPNFVVRRQDRIQNPRFITCYDMYEKFLSFSMCSRISRNTFLRFSFCSLGNFWNQLGTNFLHAHFEGQNFVEVLAIQIQHTTDHSDCQTSIRPHEIPHFGHIFVRF